MWLTLLLPILLIPTATQADDRTPEFCRVNLLAVPAPLQCKNERFSGDITREVVTVYQSICPTLQERFEQLELKRAETARRCVAGAYPKAQLYRFFSTPREVRYGKEQCAEETKKVQASVQELKTEVGRFQQELSKRIGAVAEKMPSTAECRTFGMQHNMLLTDLRERLQRLDLATTDLERRTEGSDPFVTKSPTSAFRQLSWRD